MTGVPHDWTVLADYLLREIGYQISEQKFYLLDRACMPLMQAAGVASVASLVDRIRVDPMLRQQVVEGVTINESLFFRDATLWVDLPNRLLPEIVAEITFKGRLDILMCACATGQELYTLSICLREHLPVLKGCSVRVVAADIDMAAVERARAGIYSDFEVSRGLSPERRERWFDRIQGRDWRAKVGLLPDVQFEQINLAQDFSFAQRFDLVFCRNVLIYFTPEGKKRALDRLATYTNNHGYLVLGSSETTWGITDSWLRRRMDDTTFYQKKY